MAEKPAQGQDVRLLHRNVRELVDGVNTLVNMTARWDGQGRGIGVLSLYEGRSELVIEVSNPNAGGGGGLYLPRMSLTSSKNPQKETNPVVFTCNVLGAVDGSTVAFTSNGVPLGVFPVVNQIARTGVITYAPGYYNIRADFSGDATHQPGYTTMVQIITERPVPEMNFGSTNNPSDHGEDVYFTCDMTGNPLPMPTGPINFFNNGQAFDAKLLVGGYCESRHESNLSPGHHQMEARFPGDSNWGERTERLDQIVKADATLHIDIQPEPAQTGRRFVIYITVEGRQGLPRPTGQVAIHNNGNTSQWYDLTNGEASFSVEQGLPIGTYSWFFDYSGDANYSQDYSQVFIQHVVARPPSYLEFFNVGNTPYFSYRLFVNWPPGTPGIYQMQVHDPTGSNYTGVIGIRLYGYGGWGSVDVKQGGALIWRGGVNLYFNTVPMIGNTIYFQMVDGWSQAIWISWNIPPVPSWDYNGPSLQSFGTPYEYGNPAYAFMTFIDPYDGAVISPDCGGFLNP